jgi:hypothetical protein
MNVMHAAGTSRENVCQGNPNRMVQTNKISELASSMSNVASNAKYVWSLFIA